MLKKRLSRLARVIILLISIPLALVLALAQLFKTTQATKISIDGPSGLALYEDNYLFVVELGDYHVRVRRIDLKDHSITTVAGNGEDCCYKEGAPATQVGFGWINSIAVDSHGDLFIAEDENVRKVSATTGLITTIAGNGNGGDTVEGSPALATGFKSIKGLALDSDGILFISDSKQGKIFEIDSLDGRISRVAGSGKSGFSGDGGPAVDASFFFLGSIALDSIGNLFVADVENCRIRRINRATGIIDTIARSGGIKQNCPPQPNTIPWQQSPDDPVVDAKGNIYFNETSVGRVAQVGPTADHPIIVAGTGDKGFSGVGGAATSAKLNEPSGLAVDSSGNLFIADFVNNRIFRVDTKTKRITVVAGNGLPHRLDIEL